MNYSICDEKYNCKKNKILKKLEDINTNKNHKRNKSKILEKYDFKKEKSKNKTIDNSNYKERTKSKDFIISNIEDKNITFNKNIEKKENNKKGKKDSFINTFLNYISFKFSNDKKNNFQIFQNFRVKIISEEHLIKNHLNIYHLLRVNIKKINSKLRHSYNLKDLTKLI